MYQPGFLRLYGDPLKYSLGTRTVMADRQIKRAIENGNAEYKEIKNGHAVVTYKPTGKWFILENGWENDHIQTAMLGAACGDVAGSIYEWENIKFKPEAQWLIQSRARFTDDTVMTCAVAEGLRKGLSELPEKWMAVPGAYETLVSAVKDSMLHYGRKYPRVGFGGSFRRWLASEDPQPYNSWGNGSAMRASYPGWIATSLEEAELLAEISSVVTHNHPAAIDGAKVIAGSIYLLRAGGTKEDIAAYAGKIYDLNFTLDEIRGDYKFDVSCAGSVPQAIKAFLEGNSFTDVVAGAISIGGDSDTIAAIAGSIAEGIYPIPQDIRGRVIDCMDKYLLNTIVEAVDYMEK